MIKNQELKKKIERISIIVSAVLYLLIAFDFLDKKNYWFAFGIGLISLINLAILKFQTKDSILQNIRIHSLNFIGAGLIAFNYYKYGGRFILWSIITFMYLAVVVMFTIKKNKVLNEDV